MESMINKSVKEFLATSKPAVIGKEDLSFVREKAPKGKDGKRIRSKAYNRHINSWAKGTLNERIEYIAAEHEIEVIDVNAAYTSQFCPICGAPLGKRTGNHSEKSHCPNCGEGNANTGAAKIVKERMHDPEITLYTPYPEVKVKMLARYEASKKTPDKPTE